MKIAFTGHRDSFVDESRLEALAEKFPRATWCHGGAGGFDSQVSRFAAEHNIQQECIRPDYGRFGRAAPLIRNRAIVAGAAFLVAAYDGRRSGGTFYTVNHARSIGIRVHVLRPAQAHEIRGSELA